jgi:hypothetical protein
LNTPATLLLSGLQERTLYQIFFGASTVDTSNQGASTTVYSANVSTSTGLFVSFGESLKVAFITMIGMVLGLIMMN